MFACSPFYLEGVELLKKYNCDIIKIASPEIKNLPLINKASRSGIPLIISTETVQLRKFLKLKKFTKSILPKRLFYIVFQNIQQKLKILT